MDHRTKFEGIWTRVRSELMDHVASEGMIPEALEWYGKNLDYNMTGGKLNRGLHVMETAQIIKGEELDDNEYYKAAVLGWAVELLGAFLIVLDDITDNSMMRRGKPCWYRVPSVGLIAVNDASMLESAIYYLLKRHFRHTPYYVDLLELFHDTTYQTEMGRLIDITTALEGNFDVNRFSLDKHRLMVIYKTAFYSFYLPVALGMRLTGVPESYTLEGKTVEPYKVALSILLPLGEYFQTQNDFFDFSAPPELVGKIQVGTDILENKCSWCVNIALALATPEQRKVLDENYGQKDPTAEARVKEVFEAVGVRESYAKYEAEMYERLKELIAAIPESPEAGHSQAPNLHDLLGENPQATQVGFLPHRQLSFTCSHICTSGFSMPQCCGYYCLV
ncbi:Fructose-bisphosphate aldolase [Mycena venus]|uniref:(2E,6E)-farnesyl diphosphate synthase n=1 Tax=Mycena venus TaxID=2733690 RepID=A0A8H6Y578_9AGAR|nr:Fructose-bisphosphate aldolase [Mycena venus]